ncbi:MAG: hypothetical protein H5U07_07585 [Candidatus Aminicenantes bacterium]|nr:hypothetical protein [Candidatus Aminicenantes bacterium]
MKTQSKGKIKITEKHSKRPETGEQEFYMSLPLTVSGLDHLGHEFSEKSVLLSISSQEASLVLTTPIKKETVLRLVMPLPPRLSEGKNLHLVLKGTVKEVQPLASNPRSQKVQLQLDARYFIGEAT